MARIIKSQGEITSQGFIPATKSRVIEGEVYDARIRARQIVSEGETLREAKLKEARNKAVLIEKESALKAISESSTAALHTIIQIFEERHSKLVSAKPEIRELALEIAQKVLGMPTQISDDLQERILDRALDQMRATKKLRIRGATRTLAQFRDAALRLGFELEDLCDAQEEHVSVITEFGSIECPVSVVIRAFQPSSNDV